jgi:cbb3-type cytochrome oxidase subunit 3
MELVVLALRLIFYTFKALMRLSKWLTAQVVEKKTSRPLPRQSAVSPQLASVPPSLNAALQTLIADLEELGRASSEHAARCQEEAPNLRFVRSFEDVTARANHLARRLRMRDLEVVRELSRARMHLDAVFEVTSFMAAQRRDQTLRELLGDADALAEACYRPIVEHCRRREISLSSDRAVTVLDGDKLYFFSIDDPTGLATIVLPGAFASELGWWPALVHEIGHDFYRSVADLSKDLVTALGVPANARLPSGTTTLTTADLDRALFAWHEELFADAFGTMMLGPAYIRTMMWTFGTEGKEEAARARALDDGRFEEHPPSHVRVAAACRLLGRMGYGGEGDRLEAIWRKRVGPFDHVVIPTHRGLFFACEDEPVIEIAARVGTLLYEQGMPSLGEQPLRSIFGLDFGPREHAEASLVARRLAAGRQPLVRDPRLLIAGGVLAWFDHPEQAVRIYQLVRQAIWGVAEVRSPYPFQEDRPADEARITPTLVRDALILDTLLEGPRSSQPLRWSRVR